jgi:hypothetical protein
VLRSLAERERWARIAGAYSMLISGAATITAGIIADAAYDRYYGKPLWIVGAIIEVGGIMNLLRGGTFERLASAADTYGPAQLQREWSQRALAVRAGRKIGGAVSFVLGALTIGTGVAIAAGLGDLDKEQKQDWNTALIATGGGIIGSGFVSLLVESPLESGYRAAYGADPDGGVSVDVAPTIGGAALHLRASF